MFADPRLQDNIFYVGHLTSLSNGLQVTTTKSSSGAAHQNGYNGQFWDSWQKANNSYLGFLYSCIKACSVLTRSTGKSEFTQQKFFHVAMIDVGLPFLGLPWGTGCVRFMCASPGVRESRGPRVTRYLSIVGWLQKKAARVGVSMGLSLAFLYLCKKPGLT